MNFENEMEKMTRRDGSFKMIDGESGKALINSEQYLFFDKADWLTTSEAAIYLRKFHKDGSPSIGAIYMMLQRGRLRPRKYCGRLYFNKRELHRAVDSSK
ncbi:MAG: helix-turn-helix domain-containing protein [Proteobacteria bacterium]|nr:helix-turn-helix domain-containing protein [Pseudomonadota bacterium]